MRDGILSDFKAISVQWHSLYQDSMQWNKQCNSLVWEVAHSSGQNSCAAVSVCVYVCVLVKIPPRGASRAVTVNVTGILWILFIWFPF